MLFICVLNGTRRCKGRELLILVVRLSIPLEFTRNCYLIFDRPDSNQKYDYLNNLFNLASVSRRCVCLFPYAFRAHCSFASGLVTTRSNPRFKSDGLTSSGLNSFGQNRSNTCSGRLVDTDTVYGFQTSYSTTIGQSNRLQSVG